ncbi:hypothetical protein FN846DRAFT_970375 [Sphaerosporella brunnea]|uniref:EamA domain-containing protein n=1 Tax=Sphaerosporella brunnea TaxID=1250544 RepID=A0A5J5EIL9_9PEZI|nr:hypothetical protein FN846DRAFT_970375 [Sphaerosporella brunnea]
MSQQHQRQLRSSSPRTPFVRLPSPDPEAMASAARPSSPLLADVERGRTLAFDRQRRSLRSRSPSAAKEAATKRKYVLAAVFLLLSLVSFVVQTETAVYIQSTLGWKKPYLMLYLTHGSWTVLWPFQLLVLKARKPHIPWSAFLKAHISSVRTTARMIMAGTPHLSPAQSRLSPDVFMLRRIVGITCALTVAGSTWYVAVNMTTPSDLTAIYNCSAFFAYVFSIFMLHERIRGDKIFSVVVACVGVLIVAYGDQGSPSGEEQQEEAANRTLGNLIIGVGSVMYGFYEVLYKKAACPPEGINAGRSIVFANAVGTGLGATTLLLLWIPIPLLHLIGLEPFELPHGQAAWLMCISVLSNAVFSGSFLVLISLTSPVLSSVAALLTIFLVAITDWILTEKPLTPAAVMGGVVICVAFFLLAWSTYREMSEDWGVSDRKKEDDDDEVWSEEEDV